jgi:hypothetical protein
LASLLELAISLADAKTPQQVVTLDPLGSDRLMRLGLTREDLATIHAHVMETVADRLAAAEVSVEDSWWTVK